MGNVLTHLPEASTEKHSETRSLPSGLACAATTMQGWRRNNEDAYLVHFGSSALWVKETQKEREADSPVSQNAPELSNSTDEGDGVNSEKSNDGDNDDDAVHYSLKSNEATTSLPGGAHLFGVFDGHGGKGVARFIAKNLLGHLCDAWRDGVEVETALLRACMKLDESLRTPAGLSEVQGLNITDSTKVAPILVNAHDFEPIKRIRLNGKMYRKRDYKKDGKSHLEFILQDESGWLVRGGEIPMTKSMSNEGHYEVPQCVLRGERTPEHQGSTGIVVVYLLPTEDAPYGKLVTANVGDSRAVLGRGNDAIALSEDQKPSWRNEQERIRNAGGHVSLAHDGELRVCGNLNFTRAFGDFQFKNNTALPPDKQIVICVPEITTQVLTKDDTFFLLACDGIWEMKSSQAVVDFVNRKNIRQVPEDQLTTITEALCDDVLCPTVEAAQKLRGCGLDNMTVVLVRLPMQKKD